MEIEWAGQRLHLLPEKAVFWRAERTLIISDLHIGKIAHFRREGFAVPREAIAKNFNLLDKLILENNAWRILFTGDLFHSDINHEWEIFSRWRRKYHSVEMDLIIGNHDRLPEEIYTGLPLRIWAKSMMLGPVLFTHHPVEPLKDQYIMSGHIHPVVKLYGKANQHFRLPCFYFSKQQAILPSFGYFTGGYQIDPMEGDTVVAIADRKLIDVSAVF
jgi:uncharacterized protein